MSRSLNVGLIVDSKYGSKYTAELARWGQSQPNIKITHLIIQDVGPGQLSVTDRLRRSIRLNGLRHVFRAAAFRLVSKIEAFIISKTSYKDHFQSVDLSRIVPNELRVRPDISGSGFVYRYPKQDIISIKNLGLDILVRCGSGILRGEILSATRFGIVSFHHGDHTVNRGGPAGFWEAYFRQPQTGFMIQQLTDELDGGHVLQRGRFGTKFLYLRNQASIYSKSNVFMQKLLSDIAETNQLPPVLDSSPYFNPLFRMPGLRQTAKYFVAGVAGIAQKLWGNLLRKRYRWNVAYSKSNWKNLVMHRGKKISPPKGHFLADPFLINENGKSYCFVEDYKFSTGIGSIAVYSITDGGACRLGEVLNEPFHLSFPYIFRFNSKIYMCPETSEKKEIRIYEAVNFPLEWRLASTIMTGISAADNMLFERDGKWWLFSNIDSTGSNDHCSELHIFFAESPLSQDWRPHAANPVIIDSACGRNGGILFDGDDTFRVSQVQGFELYGKSFDINRITNLTETEYCEDKYSSIEPNFFENIAGAHHIHSNGYYTVFDYVEFTNDLS